MRLFKRFSELNSNLYDLSLSLTAAEGIFGCSRSAAPLTAPLSAPHSAAGPSRKRVTIPELELQLVLNISSVTVKNSSVVRMSVL